MHDCECNHTKLYSTTGFPNIVSGSSFALLFGKDFLAEDMELLSQAIKNILTKASLRGEKT